MTGDRGDRIAFGATWEPASRWQSDCVKIGKSLGVEAGNWSAALAQRVTRTKVEHDSADQSALGRKIQEGESTRGGTRDRPVNGRKRPDEVRNCWRKIDKRKEWLGRHTGATGAARLIYEVQKSDVDGVRRELGQPEGWGA